MAANRIHPPFRHPEKQDSDMTLTSVPTSQEEQESESLVISSENESTEPNDVIDDEFRVPFCNGVLNV